MSSLVYRKKGSTTKLFHSLGGKSSVMSSADMLMLPALFCLERESAIFFNKAPVNIHLSKSKNVEIPSSYAMSYDIFFYLIPVCQKSANILKADS